MSECTEMMTSYLVATPCNLLGNIVDITTRRRSLDGTQVLMDFYCFCEDITAINQILDDDHQIENWSEINDLTVSTVSLWLREGFTLYTYANALALMDTSAWCAPFEF